MKRFAYIATAFAAQALFAMTAAADPIEGLWLTQADQKGRMAIVRTEPCNGLFCAVIVRMVDRDGNEIPSSSVNRKVFWDVAPTGRNRYEGRGALPGEGGERTARLQIDGDEMLFGVCLGPVCDQQIWDRVK